MKASPGVAAAVHQFYKKKRKSTQYLGLRKIYYKYQPKYYMTETYDMILAIIVSPHIYCMVTYDASFELTKSM